MTTDFNSRKLLSIQSHVVHGYVGNRAATFPLQIRGLDVDVLNTVQFSNHPAYGRFKGTRLTEDELKELYEGLVNIDCEYDGILTGYIPSDEGLKAIGEICRDLIRKNPATKWFLDPVLGDNGKIYVSEGNIEIYKGILKSGLITLVTPNQLELEVLSESKVHDLASLKRAIDKFNDLYNIPNVVVTSVKFNDEDGYLYSAGSTRVSEKLYKSFYFKVPVINASFSGSGDLFSALLASDYFKGSEEQKSFTEETPLSELPLVHSLNEVISTVEKVLQLTYDHEINRYKSAGQNVPANLKINDLKVIQGKKYYLQYLEKYQAHSL
ncbi:hypothetical protein WICMUC_005461 [Wickerhamomyces mucosus]|uniref:pyridoxal kinase n=1 Tax=Wickerhamomyces mucosus TaxID=1378264 RepID=A0A9P8T679_9ASCO|nr:hypothetical protein WICMUC_005461 [Wickerhamomyces mucosus]